MPGGRVARGCDERERRRDLRDDPRRCGYAAFSRARARNLPTAHAFAPRTRSLACAHKVWRYGRNNACIRAGTTWTSSRRRSGSRSTRSSAGGRCRLERWWGWGGDGQGGAEVGVGRAGDDVGLQRRGVGGWWRKGGSLCAPERAWTASRMPAVCCSVLRFCNGQCAGQELTQKMIKDGPES